MVQAERETLAERYLRDNWSRKDSCYCESDGKGCLAVVHSLEADDLLAQSGGKALLITIPDIDALASCSL